MKDGKTIRQRFEEWNLNTDLEGKPLDVDEAVHVLLDRYEALLMENEDLRTRVQRARQSLEGNF